MYMASSNAWSVPIASRGNYGNNTNFLPNEGSYFSVAGFDSVSDCATACDTDNQCNAFSASLYGGKYLCSLYNQQVTMSGKPGTTYVKTKSAAKDGLIMGNSIAPTAIDPASGQIMAAGECGGNRQIDNSGHGGPCGAGKKCCVQYAYDAKACPIKGSIMTVEQDYTNYTTNYASGSTWSRAPKVVCGYQNLDSGWLNDNIQNLGQYFDDKNSKLAGLQWCNNLSVSQLAETTNETFCKQAAGSSFAQFLTQKLKGSDWFTDPKGFQLLNEACIGDSTTDTDCSTLLASVPASTTLNSDQVDQINGIITGASSTVKTAGSNLVKTICDRDPTNPQCACYNLVKYKIDGCSSNPNFPGCSDPDIQAVVQLLPELATMGASGAALQTNMNMFSQNLLASANSCVKAALSGTNVLLPNKPSGSPVQLNTCVQRIDLSGAEVSGSDISAACNINAGSSDTPPKANPNDVPQDGPNVGLIAGGIGGTTCIMSSSSSVCLLILAAVLMIH